jgi:hypothetical protein
MLRNCPMFINSFLLLIVSKYCVSHPAMLPPPPPQAGFVSSVTQNNRVGVFLEYVSLKPLIKVCKIGIEKILRNTMLLEKCLYRNNSKEMYFVGTTFSKSGCNCSKLTLLCFVCG